ncbi:protein translocase subunit SecY [Clostridium pasteurianum DSM 525 = ATCC 6013]|uniref:Protein translocase subunit SecY n=1 Tax=Clostridium pasteurianum DSM 525 = ATCC 6013 TaxID=1262449 RepID=A0A0H3J722_CLOPA|nr:preprotein translocase subunit SecY [Clostridium pasteurianum]AJA49711.1 protein translocase subunit SecY [Clostridium pasteurianum DSM 525 = ATCC 6013]AJA53699.1 protein translocase subunit SecY [Clostridium pasteurianum DSM 525 = ATCC 6013]AOZ76860.1 preprotein translocase subunit SecY [Clostridium pasteurianum DSM 525 = ATCC 6013]AOZ80657.1 preprotein translocase subunit SecY [Clostridium pasteurianum]ELP57599.1 preprotein translocase subunit SecY [Clostridium pasteurianum DSM 525 = ATCC
MLSTLRNAWKVPDLRKRLLWTLVLVIIYRIGIHIPVPGVDTSKLVSLSSQSGSLAGFYDLMSGGAFSNFSIFSMSVMPYINASIIVQLLTIAIPSLEQMQKEGEEGRKKIQKLTRYSSVFLAAFQTFAMYAIINSQGALRDTSKLNMFLIALTLTTASVFLMWLGEQITVKGIGNGISLIMFVNIVSRIPSTIYQIITLQQTGTVDVVQITVLIVIILALFLAVIMACLAERRIPVQYAGKAVNSKALKGQSSHIPININASAIIAIIFAMAVMQFPMIIVQFWPNSWIYKSIVSGQYSIFRQGSWEYAAASFIFIIFFTWFYTQITLKPDEMAENMHKSSGFIPGIRPGEQTARYIEKILDKVSILWGVFAGVIAIAPMILQSYTKFQGLYFGGTGLLIVVGVAIETMKAIEAQLVMKHYEGFLSE